ncbi:hypothetical protein [Thioalkalivibrio sp. AKL7]|uniref:hypothetical protein n=1 Tax=Thioalkalivibrio sp. AKL7 TaxID=1158155 RepID=UPI001E39A097|nr:hypothetical protein [Thioalkalivibrio sp. AKL7]
MMKPRLILIMLPALLAGCGGSAETYKDREAAYDRSSECHQAREDSEDCRLAYEALIEIERGSTEDGEIDAYKEKYCSGLSHDDLLCEVGKVISLRIDQEQSARVQARVEHYLGNRSELRDQYNECGSMYYEEAGLERDGAWIGAAGVRKLHRAKSAFSEEFNEECRVAADAANRLKIEFAHYFVKVL